MKIYYCEMDTSHYSWRFFTTSEEDAENAIKTKWIEFCESEEGEGCDPDYVNQDSWNILEMNEDDLYRDYDRVLSTNEII